MVEYLSGERVQASNRTDVYDKLTATGTERKTGYGNYYRLTTKFLTGHSAIGKQIDTITLKMRSAQPISSGGAVPIGVWNDSGGTIKTNISPAITNRLTDSRLVNSATIQELTFSFSSSS